MAQTYNVQIEDSSGNKYCPKPDLLTTKEQLAANNASGKSVDALVVKEINNNLQTQLPGNVRIISEGSGADAKYFAQIGADAASKKRLGNITYLGQFISTNDGISNVRTFDLSSLTEYKKLTADQMFIEYVSFTSYAARMIYAYTLSYDSVTGVLSVSGASKGSNCFVDKCIVNVYSKQ